jgi:hypothetical protein
MTTIAQSSSAQASQSTKVLQSGENEFHNQIAQIIPENMIGLSPQKLFDQQFNAYTNPKFAQYKIEGKVPTGADKAKILKLLMISERGNSTEKRNAVALLNEISKEEKKEVGAVEVTRPS